MNHLIIFLFCLSTCLSIASSLSLDVNLNLLNICPSGLFTYDNKGVNSFYDLFFTSELIKGSGKINFNSFNDHFESDQVKELDNLKNQFNKEIDGLFSDYLSETNFYERNFTVKIKRFSVIKQAFQKFVVDGDDKSAGQKELKSCIETINKAGRIARRLKNFQNDFLPDGELNSTDLEARFDEFHDNINPESEEMIFSKKDFIDNIKQIGVFKKVYIMSDNLRTQYNIKFRLLVPFHNKIYDNYECINADNLPVFYRMKGRGHFKLLGKSKSNGFASQSNIFTISIVQLGMIYYFKRNKF